MGDEVIQFVESGGLSRLVYDEFGGDGIISFQAAVSRSNFDFGIAYSFRFIINDHMYNLKFTKPLIEQYKTASFIAFFLNNMRSPILKILNKEYYKRKIDEIFDNDDDSTIVQLALLLGTR